MSEVRVLTTGEAAKYCGVNFRTIIRWIERGRLKAYKLPGRGDHRIREDDFVVFLKENDFPIPEEFEAQSSRVLVVEDSKEMASAIARVLRREGMDVAIAHDGFSAGAMMSSHKPRMITLDLKMPGLDGFGVLEFIRNNSEYKSIKVLVISAEPPAALERALVEGASAVMEKPFDNIELVEKIQELLSN
ncbi:response regulator [Sessilibacter corallicola]|uniref:response regulator n=1 Tax=Sessilibacter corallicola TaxID=2904075 RepID=UPI001E652F05|nr:response regulator [Sessilibacter corallicola]MCE2027569.1 response regulator [Sessilibacter corallicola]